MQKSLKTLIKLAQRNLDGLRRDLNIYLDKKDELLRQKEALRQGLLREQELLVQMPDAHYAYANYAMLVKVKQENLDKFIAGLDKEIEMYREKIAEAFQELKRYDILLDLKKKREAEEDARRERIEMDEIGMNLHRRKENSDA